MRQALRIHPDFRCAAVKRIEVEIARPRPGALALSYFLTGSIGDLRMPPLTTPARADKLWRRTCFEAFVIAPPNEAYLEFNFAPSTQWAAYRFSGYRTGMSAAKEIAPRIALQTNEEGCELRVSLELDQLPDLSSDKVWRLGLSAVIEETSGRTSYWALAHPPGKADFHHAEGFAIELSAPEQA